MKNWESDTFLARWLNGELSSDELKEFEQSEEFAKFQKIKEATENLETASYDEEEEFRKLLGRIEEKKAKPKQFRIQPILRYAAAAALILSVPLVIYLSLFNDEIVDFTASQNEKIELPDGSSVQLRSQSNISYNATDWSENRVITLDGEAFFDVEEGEKFEVKMESGAVRVLGTSFNITESADTLKVTCYSGKVEVEAFGDLKQLEVGESITLAEDFIEEGKTSMNLPVWINQSATFRNVALRVVIEEFEEQYEVKVLGKFDLSQNYTGQFPVNDIEIAMAQIFGPYNLDWELDEENGEVFIIE